ncbi:hypothetical protein E3N88_07633 [Mikania micrantha]|uniref:Uncharacterized protein n=1 Tax=Mikania micrantha TaxID=192012 RepID=A0A5N6PU79_9ASTR|nr:hypothetical protein E3N88_07633 [Mikania micrantha]
MGSSGLGQARDGFVLHFFCWGWAGSGCFGLFLVSWNDRFTSEHKIKRWTKEMAAGSGYTGYSLYNNLQNGYVDFSWVKLLLLSVGLNGPNSRHNGGRLCHVMFMGLTELIERLTTCTVGARGGSGAGGWPNHWLCPANCLVGMLQWPGGSNGAAQCRITLLAQGWEHASSSEGITNLKEEKDDGIELYSKRARWLDIWPIWRFAVAVNGNLLLVKVPRGAADRRRLMGVDCDVADAFLPMCSMGCGFDLLDLGGGHAACELEARGCSRVYLLLRIKVSYGPPVSPMALSNCTHVPSWPFHVPSSWASLVHNCCRLGRMFWSGKGVDKGAIGIANIRGRQLWVNILAHIDNTLHGIRSEIILGVNTWLAIL